jgi:hypothetical protein
MSIGEPKMGEHTAPCQECGMPVRLGEYHPFAACLMFKGCRNQKTVRLNLDAITFEWKAIGSREKEHQMKRV